MTAMLKLKFKLNLISHLHDFFYGGVGWKHKPTHPINDTKLVKISKVWMQFWDYNVYTANYEYIFSLYKSNFQKSGLKINLNKPLIYLNIELAYIFMAKLWVLFESLLFSSKLVVP